MGSGPNTEAWAFMLGIAYVCAFGVALNYYFLLS
jgi:hypothetical protein